jgi:hypothetical protein
MARSTIARTSAEVGGVTAGVEVVISSPHLERGTRNGEAKTTQLLNASYRGEFIQG